MRRLAITVTLLAGSMLLLEAVAFLLYPERSGRFLCEGIADGQPVWIDNRFFPYRFLAERTAPAPIPVVARKEPPAGALRVCLVGDSALMGAPNAAFGVGRQLERLLQIRYPERPVEVIPMGWVEEGNSHVLREAVRDLRRLKPDAVIVSIGNHEVSGPFGPASGAGGFTPGFRLARALAVISRTRLMQLYRAGMTRLFPARADVLAWRHEENPTLAGRMSPADPRLEEVYRSFSKNLTAILQEARRAAPVVMACTVPVNLRDCAPFSTSYLEDETAAQQVREILRMARVAETATNQVEAARLYAEAIRLDPVHAEGLYRAARLALQQDQAAEAAALFLRARDADALRLRADSRLNGIIRATAAEAGVLLVDAEALFADTSPEGIPGNNLFLDHIHFTFDASRLLANALLARLEAAQAIGPAPSETDSKSLAGELFYHPWGRAAQMEAVLKQQLRLPFRRQLTHPETIARLNEEKTTWDAHAAALSPASTRAIVSRQLAGRPNDPWLAARGAWLLLEANDFDRAEAAAQAAQRQWPHRLDIRALLCLIRALQGQDARDGFPFLQGDSDNGDQEVELAVAIGRELLARKRPADARLWLTQALERDAWNSEASVLLAEVYHQLEGRNLALENLVNRLEQDPRQRLSWTSVFLREALKQLKPEGYAIEFLQQAIKRNPDNPLLWEKLAVLYTLRSRGNDWQIATRCYNKVSDIAPYRYDRYLKWAEAMYRLRQYKRANIQISRYLTFMPHDPEGLALQARIQAKLPSEPEPVTEPPEEKSARRFPWE